jgi:hypothetical protein
MWTAHFLKLWIYRSSGLFRLIYRNG